MNAETSETVTHPLSSTETTRSRVVRWVVVAVAIVHGLIHLLGVAKGFGWAEISALEEPISTAGGIVWLVACVLVVSTGALLAVRSRGWWPVGAVAVIVSQIVIVSSWSDASAGTAANLILLAAVVYGFAANNPFGAHKRTPAASTGTAHAITPTESYQT